MMKLSMLFTGIIFLVVAVLCFAAPPYNNPVRAPKKLPVKMDGLQCFAVNASALNAAYAEAEASGCTKSGVKLGWSDYSCNSNTAYGKCQAAAVKISNIVKSCGMQVPSSPNACYFGISCNPPIT